MQCMDNDKHRKRPSFCCPECKRYRVWLVPIELIQKINIWEKNFIRNPHEFGTKSWIIISVLFIKTPSAIIITCLYIYIYDMFAR